jgi:hypothetical protein
MQIKFFEINSLFEVENLKNIIWISTIIISIILYLKKYIKNRMTKAEKDLLEKIKSNNNQKIIFIKFDNADPFSKEVDINHNDEDLISLTNKGILIKTEQGNSIIYTIS